MSKYPSGISYAEFYEALDAYCDAMIRAALEAGAERGWQVGCPLNTAKAIRALADDPEVIAAIKAKAVGRT